MKGTKSIADAFTGTSSADSTGIELDQDNLGERQARLEKMFNRITELTDSHYSVELEPDPQVHAPSLYNTQSSSLHDPQAFLLHDPSTDKKEEPRGKLRNQYILLRGSSRLRSSTDCKEKSEAVGIKLELGSETTGLTSSPTKHCGLRESREIEEVKETLRTVKDHEDWLDRVHDQQFGTSTMKEEPSKALQESEDWFDHEETNSEKNGSFWLLYSEKEQIQLMN